MAKSIKVKPRITPLKLTKDIFDCKCDMALKNAFNVIYNHKAYPKKKFTISPEEDEFELLQLIGNRRHRFIEIGREMLKQYPDKFTDKVLFDLAQIVVFRILYVPMELLPQFEFKFQQSKLCAIYAQLIMTGIHDANSDFVKNFDDEKKLIV